MKTTSRYFTAVSIVLTLAAFTGCSGSDEGSAASDTSADAADQPATDDGGAPSAEIEAMAEKITLADSSIETSTAQCIASTMIADGTIGGGEVLTMDFFDLSSNADRLQEAYAAAVEAC